jgi:hypothetical protein
LPHCRSQTSNFYFNVGAKIRNFKFEVKFNKFGFFHSKYYLHEVAAQEENMKYKRILLTASQLLFGKKRINSINITTLFLLTFL